MEIDQTKEALLLASDGNYSKLYEMMVKEYILSYTRERLIRYSIRYNEQGILKIKDTILEAMKSINYDATSNYDVELLDFDMERCEANFNLVRKNGK
jgi:hypothetical protein